MEHAEEPYENENNKQTDIVKGKENSKGWEIEEITIRCAENGYSLRASYRRKKESKNNDPMGNYKTEEYVSEDLDSVFDSLRDLLGEES